MSALGTPAEAIQALNETGFTVAPFGLSEADRALYTAAAVRVLILARTDEDIASALSLNVYDEPADQVHMADYGLIEPGYSHDKKVSLHVGYQTQEWVDAAIPKRRQPREMRNFWMFLDEVLFATEDSVSGVLDTLEMCDLRRTLFGGSHQQRNVQIRTTLNLGGAVAPQGERIISDHLDIGVATALFYETHRGGLQSKPNQGEAADYTAVKYDRNSQMALLFGSGLFRLKEGMPHLPIKGLVASRHHVDVPAGGYDDIARSAAAVTGDATHRAVSLAFLHPVIPVYQAGHYRHAAVGEFMHT